jgi:hypothetical protein
MQVMSETNSAAAVPVGAADPVGSGQNVQASASANVGAALAAAGVSAVVADAGTIAAAALASNAAPASVDPVMSALDNLHARVAAVEAVVNPVAGIASAAIPNGASWMERLAAVEAVAEKLMGAAEGAVPLLTRLENAFNVHFNGKV